MKARFDYLCAKGCTARQDTGNLLAAFNARVCPTCGGAVELRRVRLLKSCCAAEDGESCRINCPRVRRTA